MKAAGDRLVGSAYAAVCEGDADAAERLLRQSMRSPGLEDRALHRGWKAMEGQEWEAAARWWVVVQTVFPATVTAYLERAVCLRQLDRISEADAQLAAGLERFPATIDLLLHHVWLAAHRKDWQAVIERSERGRILFPREPRFYTQGALAARALGHLRKTDDLLRHAATQFPEDRDVARQLAMNAELLGDAELCSERWRAVRDRFPDDAAAAAQFRRHKYEQAIRSLSVQRAERLQPIVDAEDRSAAATIMAGCESLGGDCEFGFVQRHFGVEPLSLLRWARVSPAQLIEGLRTGWEDIGSEDFTELNVNPFGEWITADRRFFTDMHSHVRQGACDATSFARTMRTRLQFLSRKLQQDLVDGTKLFVYKSNETIARETILSIARHTRLYGPGCLLCVQPSDSVTPPGTHFALAAGVHVAFLDVMAKPRSKGADFQSWFTACSSALRATGKAT